MFFFKRNNASITRHKREKKRHDERNEIEEISPIKHNSVSLLETGNSN